MAQDNTVQSVKRAMMILEELATEKEGFGCLTLIKNKKPPKALMGLFFLSNLPNISCGMLRDVLLYK